MGSTSRPPLALISLEREKRAGAEVVVVVMAVYEKTLCTYVCICVFGRDQRGSSDMRDG